jgi:membrane-bound lytic murein transglycosylase D
MIKLLRDLLSHTGWDVFAARTHFFVVILLLLIIPLPAFTYSAFDDLVERDEVQRYIERFLTREHGFFERSLGNAERYLSTVKQLFQGQGLPEELVYLPIIESGYSPRAYSRAGASGMWQFMPTTAQWQGLCIDFWVDERRDPVKSTHKAIAHLRYLHEHFGEWELALAAYNAGIGSIDLAIRRAHTRDFWVLGREGYIKSETREYVPRFIASAYVAANYERYGFSLRENTQFTAHETIEIDRPVDLSIFSKNASIPLSTLQFLNPELNRLITPVGRRYVLRVPEEHFADALRVYHELPKEVLVGVTHHTIRYGETLGGIAQRYDTSVTLIKHLNNIRNPKKLYAGRTVLVPLTTERNELPAVHVNTPSRGFHTQEIHYTIQRGDTLWEIARRYDSDVETLLFVNGMSFSSVIKPGDEITLWLDLAFAP